MDKADLQAEKARALSHWRDELPEPDDTCQECGGDGYEDAEQTPDGKWHPILCAHCHGTGKRR